MEGAAKIEAKKEEEKKVEEIKKEGTKDEVVKVVKPEEKEKKKKKKKKKKDKKVEAKEGGEEKKEGSAVSGKEEVKAAMAPRAQDNSIFRILGSWKDGESKQTNPPMIPVQEQFPDGKYPLGVISEYKGPNSYRMANAALKEKEALREADYNCFRKAAECHRQVRKYAQSIIRPGKKYISMVTDIENAVRRVIKANKIEAGLAFPCGCSINNCAAHFSPNPGDDKIMQKGDVVKFDFGTHVNGYVIDSAFTVAFDPTFDNLLTAAKEATNTGIREAGIDARLEEIGEKIQETMESHEVEIKGKTYKVRCIRNLQGHEVGRYKIHAGKTVPTVKGGEPGKMEEGEVYAIETFGSTGKGMVSDDLDCSHYMKSPEPKHGPIKNTRSKFLLKLLEENYSTLAFCRRWIDDLGFEKHYSALKPLVDAGAVNPYPPLVDVPNSYVAQFEHTFLLKPTSKEVLSMGDDY